MGIPERIEAWDTHVHLHGRKNSCEKMETRKIARQLVDSGLDGAVLIVGPNGSVERFGEVREEVSSITAGTALEISLQMGAELSIRFDGVKYHILCFFPDGEGTRPEIPKRVVDLHTFEQFVASYEIATSVAHPMIVNGGVNTAIATTRDLFQHPSINGAEIFNGAVQAKFWLSNAWISRQLAELAQYAKKTRQGVFAFTGGSDSPRPGIQIGNGVTRFAAREGGLVEAIRSGDTWSSSRPYSSKRQPISIGA